MKFIGHTFFLVLFAVGSLVCAQSSNAQVNFKTQIAPILSQHCIRCHTPGNKKGDLSLATSEDLIENEHLVAGDPEASYLIELITPVDGEQPEMPKDAEPLAKEQIELIRNWIEQGNWPTEIVVQEQSKADASWWSLQPVAASFESETIDEFVDPRLAEQNLKRNPPSDRRSLIRRATYDLTGLPPSPEEVKSFVEDTDPQAYEKLIDRLLESPHYGQRWGRHWLDVVRFGESNGFERNVIINNLWPFRDYVIRSINEDKPFDQFIREHIAGDVFGAEDPDIAVGSAFLVAGPYDNVGNQDAAQAAQIRANTLDEMISATSQAFLGLTVSCARCHNHKFDPITQQDYYAFYATFAGVRHGAVPLANSDAKAERNLQLKPLKKRQTELDASLAKLKSTIMKRAKEKLSDYEAQWTRPPVDRTGTEETFETVTAKFVRLVCEAQDANPGAAAGFRIDEFEVWSDEPKPRNVALATLGGTATGKARQIEDFAGAYGPQLAIDGKTGARFISTGTDLTIELARPTDINRVVFSSARNETTPSQGKFAFVGEYRIEVSDDGNEWREVAHGRDRKPANQKQHLNHRLAKLETSAEERAEQARLAKVIAQVKKEISKVPAIPSVWIGTRNANDAKGPFHIFLGGSPQKKGSEVVPGSLSVLNETAPHYELPADAKESERRVQLANWITHPDNPLTARVLANRLWHYHFGTGIVDTPSDFGYMGGRPTHPELLDFLANKLQENDWRLKPMHRLIMTSQTYQQSARFKEAAAKIDGDTRLLWRFPPRRLSAEEIRDTILSVAGKLDTKIGGPGFRLYRFMQDNVCTYVPLDKFGPETYRRSVYHQNARASVVDLMTDFDLPDCAFSIPKRSETTTPLQALTMLNHRFTLDMAEFLAQRLQTEAGDKPVKQIQRAYQICFLRPPAAAEISACQTMIEEHGLPALCRVLLNTSELIYVQ